jgi:putative DNA-invertase from lambdoid prophage Rac
MVFTVLGAVAELERSLIVERVRAGLRNARAKGKRLGRPRKIVDVARVGSLRAQGRSWRKIARVMECSAKTCRRAWQKSTSEGLRTIVDKNPDPRSAIDA